MQAPNNQPYDVPAYLHGDGSFEGYTPYGAPMQAQQLPEKKMVSVDVGEFVRTRDALSSAYMSLSSSIDRAVKAYIDHTNVVLAGDASLNVTFLTQPFDQLAHTAVTAQQFAQQALHHNNGQNVDPALKEEEPEGKGKGKRKKRPYKQRDPNAPKRPLTAYFRFLQEQRGPLGQELAERAGGQPQKPGDLSKQATERWNALSKEEQQPYRDAYQRALKDYDKDVVKYKQQGGTLTEKEEKALAAKLADAEEEPEAVAAAEQVDDEQDAEGEDEDDSDESSSEDDDEEEEEPAPPPPPPPKATPKSAMKKSKQAAAAAAPAPTPSQFNSVNPSLPAAATPAAGSSSPERKRKTPATSSDTPAAAATEEPAKKKRGRKSNAEKVAAAADPPAAPQPAAPVAQMSSDEPAKKKKKTKKNAE